MADSRISVRFGFLIVARLTAANCDRPRSTRAKPDPVASVRIGWGAARCTPPAGFAGTPRAAGGGLRPNAESYAALRIAGATASRCLGLPRRLGQLGQMLKCSDAQALNRCSGEARPPPRGGCRFSGGGVHRAVNKQPCNSATLYPCNKSPSPEIYGINLTSGRSPLAP